MILLVLNIKDRNYKIKQSIFPVHAMCLYSFDLSVTVKPLDMITLKQSPIITQMRMYRHRCNQEPPKQRLTLNSIEMTRDQNRAGNTDKGTSIQIISLNVGRRDPLEISRSSSCMCTSSYIMNCTAVDVSLFSLCKRVNFILLNPLSMLDMKSVTTRLDR